MKNVTSIKHLATILRKRLANSVPTYIRDALSDETLVRQYIDHHRDECAHLERKHSQKKVNTLIQKAADKVV